MRAVRMRKNGQKMLKQKYQYTGKFELSDKLSLGDPFIPLQISIKTQSFLIRKCENLTFEFYRVFQKWLLYDGTMCICSESKK